MLFVAMAVFQALDLPLVAEPLNALLSQLANFVPQLAGAVILLTVAWVVATVLRTLVSGALRAVKIDQRLGGELGETPPETAVADNLGEAVYWLVFLLFLPAVLGALALDGLLQPVQSFGRRVAWILAERSGCWSDSGRRVVCGQPRASHYHESPVVGGRGPSR